MSKKQLTRFLGRNRRLHPPVPAPASAMDFRPRGRQDLACPRMLRAGSLFGFLFVVALLFPAMHAWAQEPILRPDAPTPLPSAGATSPLIDQVTPDTAEPAVPATYRIGAGDLLSIYVLQMPSFSRQVRVDNNGDIQIPLVSKSFRAEGETPATLAQSIGDELTREELARNPIVEVTVRQVLSKPVVIAGAVQRPGTIEVTHPLTLLDAIAQAGGLSQNAGTTAIVTFSTSVGSATRVISLSKLLYQQDLTENMVLHGGESIRIPTADLVYAVGSLKRPGAYPLVTNQPISAVKILALAGGVSRPAKLSHSELIHIDPATQARTIVPLNLDAILQHKAPDVTLHPGDILYVPHDGGSDTLQAILRDAGQAAVLAVGYRLAN